MSPEEAREAIVRASKEQPRFCPLCSGSDGWHSPACHIGASLARAEIVRKGADVERAVAAARRALRDATNEEWPASIDAVLRKVFESYEVRKALAL